MSTATKDREARLARLRGENVEVPAKTVATAREGRLARLRGETAAVSPTQALSARDRRLARLRGEPIADTGATCGALCRCIESGACQAIDKPIVQCTRPTYAADSATPFHVMDETTGPLGELRAKCARRGCLGH